MSEEIKKAVNEERERCLAWVQHARGEGETDMRQVTNWINTLQWPDSPELAPLLNSKG